ncbi:MAG: hypothetical protein LBE50_04250 [Gallionellaceae bacterium]|jgi:hypothetical protein|nr:hypothetical protein [Gallionellaceae bacterium]
MNFFEQFFSYLPLNRFGADKILPVLTDSASQAGVDLSIEGMRSQQFSQGVFVFMLVTILVFAAIVYAVVFGKYAPATMRTGEKLMFGAIILGIIAAVIFGALQMLSGYLF